MKRILFLIFAIFLFSGCGKKDEQQRSWNRFLGITEESLKQQEQITPQQIYPPQTYQSSLSQRPFPDAYKNPVYTPYDNKIKYKIQRKPLGGAYGENEYEFVIRN